MLEINLQGQNQYGVWLKGDLVMGGFTISGIFATNLKELPKEKELKVKKVKISTSRKGLPLFRVEF